MLYTGGTIGMKPSDIGYVPDPEFPEKVKEQIGSIKNQKIPEFDIISFNPLLDSSNMTPSEWDKIAAVIHENFDDYSGFIVLHGTDTMAYTASALSFLLPNLTKNVIVSGSQIPFCEIRNDARENLITSLIICGNYDIPEVSLYFNNKLFRGNRTTKVDATHLSAFDSPNYPPLAEIGINIDLTKKTTFNIEVSEQLLLKPEHEKEPIHFFSQHNNDVKDYEVGVLKLFPGISANFLKSILKPPLKGLVLEAFGVGNGPTKETNPELFDVIYNATHYQDIVIVAVSQCVKGVVYLDGYAASLKAAGVVSGYDMTLEAALAKMYYLFSHKEYGTEKVKTKMMTNLRGEVSV